MEQEKHPSKSPIVALIAIIVIASGVGLYARDKNFSHDNALANTSLIQQSIDGPVSDPVLPPAASVVSHVPTPSSVNAVYVSGWSAGTRSSMDHIYSLLTGGKLNAVVVDIKDASGRLSYEPHDASLLASGVGTRRIASLPALIAMLHSKGIYVIGRVAVFQDPYYAAAHPEDALHSLTTGEIWRDDKDIAWLRADSTDVWHYTEAIAEDAYAQGFDEINLDYVRFPSDGNLSAIDETTFVKNKEDTIADFFTDEDNTLRGQYHIPLSADIFGLTMSANDGMGIGQKLELIAPHVDYVCPMVYPSHFADGSYGFKHPAEYPYNIIHASLTNGIAKLKAINLPATAIRPWLQDFSLGTVYTPDMVQAQITATNDVGLSSWLLWDPRNIYTSSVLK